MLQWIVWGLILLLQNAAFVANSRARNGKSLSYHAITNLASNGIWIISQFFAVNMISIALNTSNWWLALGIFSFYVIMNLIGGLTAHSFLLKRDL